MTNEELRRLEDQLAMERAAHRRARQELDSARRELDVLRSSTSWRLTVPVRLVSNVRKASRNRSPRELASRARGFVGNARAHGVRHAAESLALGLSRMASLTDYHRWVERYDRLAQVDRDAIRLHQCSLPARPLISVVVPVFDTDPALLRAMYASVRGQLYDHWELVLVDDASPSAATRQALRELADQPQTRLVVRKANGGIAAATADGLALAAGEWVAFLDHDDVLAEHALYLVALEVLRHPDADLVYSDEDHLDRTGERYGPYFKPQYDPDLLYASNYLNHLTVVRRSLLEQVGGLRAGFEGAQDHDLVLRLAAAAREVRRVPYVLYHWRHHDASFSVAQADRSREASRRAVQDVLGPDVQVVPAPHFPVWNRVVWPLPDPPAVTVIIPTRDRLELLRQCVDGLLERTDYPALQVLVVDNDSSETETLAWLAALPGRDPRARVLPAPGPFNYSALNNEAVRQATTPLVLLLNNDIVVRDRGWLREMASHAVRPGVGAVGARLLYDDERVQHAGVLLGIGGVAGHMRKYTSYLDGGPGGQVWLTHGVSAVTGACLLTHRDLYLRLGGLDEVDLAVAFNDVDYCLKVRADGQRIVYTPYAELFHLESASRGLEVSASQKARFNRESDVMRQRWGGWLADDPAYSPNLTIEHEDCSFADPPRVPQPWLDLAD